MTTTIIYKNMALEDIPVVKDRADTDQKKADVVRRILNVWKKQPNLRLSQLIHNAIPKETDVCYLEDYELVNLIEDFEMICGRVTTHEITYQLCGTRGLYVYIIIWDDKLYSC